MKAMKVWPEGKYQEKIRQRENLRLLQQIEHIQNRQNHTLERQKKEIKERQQLITKKLKWKESVQKNKIDQEYEQEKEKNDQLCINLERIRLGLKYRSEFDKQSLNQKLPRIQTQSYTKSAKNQFANRNSIDEFV